MASQQGMLFLMYALWDRKLREFGAPVIARNDEAAVRALADGIKGSRSIVEQHPEDFDLMQVGEFYPDSGFVGGLVGPPRLVINVSDALYADA